MAEPPGPNNQDSSKDSQLIHSGDTVAIVGGTFVDRMRLSGTFEATLQLAAAERSIENLKFRNLGWSGDDASGYARKVFGDPQEGFLSLIREIETIEPEVVIICYGNGEAASSPDGRGITNVDEFRDSLDRLVQQLELQSTRVAMMPAIPMPGVRSRGYSTRIEQFRQMSAQVAAERSILQVDPRIELADNALTADKLFPNEIGYAKIAAAVVPWLFGGEPFESVVDPSLVSAVIEKDRLVFQRLRPQNATYLFLFRKHEQGQNADEIQQYDPLIEEADRRIESLLR